MVYHQGFVPAPAPFLTIYLGCQNILIYSNMCKKLYIKKTFKKYSSSDNFWDFTRSPVGLSSSKFSSTPPPNLFFFLRLNGTPCKTYHLQLSKFSFTPPPQENEDTSRIPEWLEVEKYTRSWLSPRGSVLITKAHRDLNGVETSRFESIWGP